MVPQTKHSTAHAVHRMLQNFKTGLAWQHRFWEAWGVLHRVVQWNKQNLVDMWLQDQNSNKYSKAPQSYSHCLFGVSNALRVSFMHWKGSAGSWKSHPNLPWYNRWNEREKDVSHCKTRTEAGGAANSLLALAPPWVEVGTRKSGAKSSWSSSHYVFTAQ